MNGHTCNFKANQLRSKMLLGRFSPLNRIISIDETKNCPMLEYHYHYWPRIDRFEKISDYKEGTKPQATLSIRHLITAVKNPKQIQQLLPVCRYACYFSHWPKLISFTNYSNLYIGFLAYSLWPPRMLEPGGLGEYLRGKHVEYPSSPLHQPLTPPHVQLTSCYLIWGLCIYVNGGQTVGMADGWQESPLREGFHMGHLALQL